MIDDISQENEGVEATERPPSRPMELPDDLAQWVNQNHELVMRVQSALTRTYGPTPSDEQLWEVIASTCSPEWLSAREVLRDAEKLWSDLNSPEKVALGPIGTALDSEEIDMAMERTAHSLAEFTVINEGLRQREDLARLLNVLLVQKRMLDQSAEQTRNLLKASSSLAILSEPSVTVAFAEVSHKQGDAPSQNPQDLLGVRDKFRFYAQKLLQRPRTNPRPATRGSAPSSTKT